MHVVTFGHLYKFPCQFCRAAKSKGITTQEPGLYLEKKRKFHIGSCLARLLAKAPETTREYINFILGYVLQILIQKT